MREIFNKTNKSNAAGAKIKMMNSFKIFNPAHYLIMIFSQNKETCLLLKTLLELWKYKTIKANTFQEVESVSQLCKPEVIIMDTQSSYHQSLENLKKIRLISEFSDLPLFVISGHSQPEFRQIVLSNGADDFFVQPLNFRKMEVCLEKSISGKRNIQAEKYEF